MPHINFNVRHGVVSTILMCMKQRQKNLDESVLKLCEVLLERFGEPIDANSKKKKQPKFKQTYCSQCGEAFGPGDHGYSHCKDHEGIEPINEDDELTQKAPPGGEKMVKALKKQKGIDNPWAVAWSQYNKKHKKK